MSSWLLVAFGSSAVVSLLFGVFLAGSLRRRNLAWGAALVSLGVGALILMLLTSVESLPTVYDANPIRTAQRLWQTSDYATVAQGFLIGFLVPSGGLLAVGYFSKFHNNLLGPGAVSVSTAVLSVMFLSLVFAPNNQEVPAETDTTRFNLPDGFKVVPYLPDGLFRATSIALDSQDRLYVATRDGVVYIVEDRNGDGAGDDSRVFGAKDGMALGVEVSDDGRTVYLAGGGSVAILADEDLNGKADSTKVIIDSLPSFVYDAHSNNGIAIGPDGKMYFTLGGLSDHGPDDDPIAGSILVADLDGSNMEVYASGLRNPYDLTFTSAGHLVATDNGPDFQDQRLNWSPPDELNLIVAGREYGYPDDFGYPPPWSETSAPIAVFPSHSVPTGVIEYVGGEFPAEYQGKLFVALFGPAVNPQFEGVVEAKVVTISLSELVPGVVRGEVEDFAKGFSAPIDVAVDSAGNLFVADYVDHQVYKISNNPD